MKIREILKKLIHELDNANSGYGQKVGMLNFTTTRNGFTCEFNKEALILINDIAEKIHINNSDIANFIDLSNLFKITRKCVADFYTEECFIDYSNNEIAISGSLSEYIKSEAKKNFTTYTHYFPAWTLGMERINAISLGPVTIMNREDWIDTIDFSEKTKQRKIDFYIKELDWRNNLKSKLKKEPPVTPPLDDLAESIYDAIQNCPSILKITINGYEKDFSRKLAHLSCKTALDSISLMIGNYRVFHQQILFTERAIPLKTHDLLESDGLLWIPGFSLSERIPTLSPNKAHDIITHNQNIIKAFSLIIESLISPLSQKHPKLCSRWATALDWYGEGCREQNDAIAITKIATSLDVLSQGGKYAGILEMLKNMFNIPEDEEIFNMNTEKAVTLKKFTKNIYDNSRSKILHGTHNERMSSFAKQKEQALHITRLALLECALKLLNYDGCDTDKGFNELF